MFKEYVAVTPISVVKYINEFRFVEKDDRKTIVVMCKVNHLEEFITSMNTKYSLNIEVPPTHVTLYTLNSGPGIFLTDQSDIINLTKQVTIPVLQGELWQN